MALTNLACKAALKKAQSLNKRITSKDGDGLFFFAEPGGKGYWRYRYRILSKPKILALGVYPEVSLIEARVKHAEARKLVQDYKDPVQVKREKVILLKREFENTFEIAARKWLEHMSKVWNKRYADAVTARIEDDLLPSLGKRPIKEIKRSELLSVIRKIEEREAYEVARRALNYARHIIALECQNDEVVINVADGLISALRPYRKTHYAAMTAKQLPDFLKKLQRNDKRLYRRTLIAVELLMLVFTRTNELVQATWDEIDLEEALWIIPASRMKMKNDHIVPLSRQAIALLNELKDLNGRNKHYVFPSNVRSKKHMSEGTILTALDKLGYKGIHTGHGFRALAMTTIKEKLNSPVIKYTHDIIDRQLSHGPKDSVDKAYDRTQYLDERKLMMQDWADYLDSLK